MGWRLFHLARKTRMRTRAQAARKEKMKAKADQMAPRTRLRRKPKLILPVRAMVENMLLATESMARAAIGLKSKRSDFRKRMREKMAEINDKTLKKRNIKIPVGIGIGTGEAMVGMFGSPIKKEYTVLGAPVNLASRLERLANEDQILICNETFQMIHNSFTTEKIDHVNLKGIEGEKSIFDVIGTL